MSEFQTEEEQVEAMKKWWKENGKSVIAGVALGLLIVVGGKGWVGYSQQQAEKGSSLYEDFSSVALAGDLPSAVSKGDALISEYGASAYSMFTALQLAKLQYEAGDKVKARARLQWVVNNSKEQAITQVAQLRLARLLLDTQALDEAAALAQSVTSGSFAGEFKVIAGDVAFAKGDANAAKNAYQAALQAGVADESLLRMKLAELGG